MGKYKGQSKVREHFEFLSYLKKISPRRQKQFIKQADRPILEALSEIALNLIKKNVSLTSAQIEKLRPYEEQIYQLSLRKHSINKKKENSTKGRIFRSFVRSCSPRTNLYNNKCYNKINMDKMYMMNVDQYNAVKGGAASMQGQGGERKDPDDVAILKKHDAYVRNLNQEKIKEDKNWAELGARLKPILSTYAKETSEIVNSFPVERQMQVQTILDILTKIPKVTIADKKISINGSLMNESARQVVNDMLENNVYDPTSLIKILRGKGQVKKAKEEEEEDEEEDSEDFEDGFLSMDQTVTPGRSRSKSPQKTSTPIENRSRARQRKPDIPLTGPFSPIKTRARAQSRAKKGALISKSMEKLLKQSKSKKEKEKKSNGSWETWS